MTSGRIQSGELRPGIRCVIVGPRRSAFGAVFGVIALTVFVLGLIFIVTGPIAHPPRELGARLFLAFWSFGWIGLGSLMLLNAAWNLWGYWYLILDEENLTTTASLFAFRRHRSFQVASITDMHVQERPGGHGLITRTIVFDHDGRISHATPALSLSEAHELLVGPLRELAARRRSGWETTA